GTADRNRSHWSTSKTPSYTKSVSWQHHPLIEQNQLWRDAFYWLAWQNRILELRDVQLIGHNSYEQIRATLLSMIDWNEELRSRIGVMNYIHQRTRISRSVVAEVLAALRKGGYIEMNKGKLVAINRLPSEY
ncbi:helix-turn-helix domain-containing protein, partial [Escherichia coli]|nr:helix-turn-helix domain-containing protein [Escherichia coli]